MRLSSRLGFAAVGLCCVGYAVTLAAGCSSKSGGGGSTSSDTCANTANACIVPPPAASGAPATTLTASHNYAISKLYMGDTDRQGVTSTTAWENFGYNLDNLVTPALSTTSPTDVCTLSKGARPSIQQDGTGGIDNSFGANIMPIIIAAAGQNASSEVNTSITEGHFTVMAYVTGFDDSAGNTTSATGLTGLLLAGSSYANANANAAPAFNLTTNWPIRPSLLTGCNATSGCPGCDLSASCTVNPLTAASIKFPDAYQANGTFVNGSPATINLTLTIDNQTLSINVHAAIITFEPKAPGSVTNGTIGGALLTSELITGISGVAGSLSPSLCGGSALTAIQNEIQWASDIIVDDTSGTVSNTAGTACNGISVGLGFEAQEIAAPTPADIDGPGDAGPGPCAEAGSN